MRPNQRKVLVSLAHSTIQTLTVARFEGLMTLKQACSSEFQGAQGAFKDSMIH
jgi:hypothetical protein